MIAVTNQVTQALLTLSGSLRHHHEPYAIRPTRNMVVNSKSSQFPRRLNQQDQYERHGQYDYPSSSSPSSPTVLPYTKITEVAAVPEPQPYSQFQSQPQPQPQSQFQSVSRLSRPKRSRVSSISGQEQQLQKRRKVQSQQADLPVRGKLETREKSLRHESPQRQNIPVTVTVKVPHPGQLQLPPPRTQPTRSSYPPPRVSRSSSVDGDGNNDSPFESPGLGLQPQYDQFKRIEEKAQRAVQKSVLVSRQSLRGGAGAGAGAHQEDKRKLRSEHGGSRAKTELAQYFPAFEEMLSFEAADPDALTAKTVTVVVDDTPDFQPKPSRPDFFEPHKPPYNAERIDLAALLPLLPSSSSSTSNVLSNQTHNHVTTTHDPLSADKYAKAHLKAERHEKQMKNGDRERAQHEKYQLERLLEELRGPDWLKTLGISGITDTEKKKYEPKRALFIRETKALIDKFKRWKEEERRRKAERQQALLDAEADEDDEDDEDDEEGKERKSKSASSKSTRKPRSRKRRINTRTPSRVTSVSSSHSPVKSDHEKSKQKPKPKPKPQRIRNRIKINLISRNIDTINTGDNPSTTSTDGTTAQSQPAADSTEFDDLAARQLLQEASNYTTTTSTSVAGAQSRRRNQQPPTSTVSSSIGDSGSGNTAAGLDSGGGNTISTSTSTSAPTTSSTQGILLDAGPHIHVPFTSFFSKRHIRDAAVAGRQRGRTIFAFGQPVVDFEEQEFELPDGLLTRDALRANARNRRRVRREKDE